MHTPENEPSGRPDPRSVDVRRGGRHDVPRAAIRRARRQGRDDPPRPVQRRAHIRDARILRGYPEHPSHAPVPEFSLPGDMRVGQVLGVKHFDPLVLPDRVVDPARIALESAGMPGGRRAELDSPEDAVRREHEKRHQRRRDSHDCRSLGTAAKSRPANAPAATTSFVSPRSPNLVSSRQTGIKPNVSLKTAGRKKLDTEARAATRPARVRPPRSARAAAGALAPARRRAPGRAPASR